MLPPEKLDLILRRHEEIGHRLTEGVDPSAFVRPVARTCGTRSGRRGDPRLSRALAQEIADLEQCSTTPPRTPTCAGWPRKNCRVSRPSSPRLETQPASGAAAERRGGREKRDPRNSRRNRRRRGCAVRWRPVPHVSALRRKARAGRVEMISASEGAMGGFKEIIAEVQRQGACSRGSNSKAATHRVQRVPDHRNAGTHPYLGRDGGGSARSGGSRHAHQRRRSADRHHARAEAPAASMSTRPNRRSASPIFPAESW